MTEGDIYLFNTNDGGNIIIENGEPLIDGGLDTSVYVSLFSDYNWWGNEISSDSQKLNSKIQSILDRTLTNQTRLDAIEYAKEALQWLIDDNIAKEINVDAIISNVETMVIDIEIVQPDFETITNVRYEINWKNQLINPVNLQKPLQPTCI